MNVLVRSAPIPRSQDLCVHAGSIWLSPSSSLPLLQPSWWRWSERAWFCGDIPPWFWQWWLCPFRSWSHWNWPSCWSQWSWLQRTCLSQCRSLSSSPIPSHSVLSGKSKSGLDSWAGRSCRTWQAWEASWCLSHWPLWDVELYRPTRWRHQRATGQMFVRFACRSSGRWFIKSSLHAQVNESGIFFWFFVKRHIFRNLRYFRYQFAWVGVSRCLTIHQSGANVFDADW